MTTYVYKGEEFDDKFECLDAIMCTENFEREFFDFVAKMDGEPFVEFDM